MGGTQCLLAQVHITAIKGSQQILRAFVKWGDSFWAGLTGTWPSQQAWHLLPCCPAPGLAGQPLTTLCACLCLSAPSTALGWWPWEGSRTASPSHTNLQHTVWSSLQKWEGTSPVLPLDIWWLSSWIAQPYRLLQLEPMAPPSPALGFSPFL